MKKTFTQFLLFAIFCIASSNLYSQTYNDGIWYSLYDTDEASNVVVYTNFAEKTIFPPAESMTVNYKKYSFMSLNGKVEVQNKIDGSWQKKGEVSYSDYKNYKTSHEIALDQNATNIRYYLASGNGAYVKNHFVKLKKHILLADGGFGKTTDSKSFGNVTTNGQSNAQTVSLRSFLTTSNITITSDNDAFRINSATNLSGHTFAVGANACASANGQSGAQAGGGTLGDINQYKFDIYFCPSEHKTYNATITITDGTSTATISVSGTGIKSTQTILWEPNVEVTTTDLVTFDATALTPIYYTSSDSAIAYVDEANQLVIQSAGSVTITAHAEESDAYQSVQLSKEINIAPALPEITALPTVEPIAYGVALTDDMLVGGAASVEGSFVWNVNSEFSLIPGEHNLSISFVPANAAIYATVEAEVFVNVLKGKQTITWDDDIFNATVGQTVMLTATAVGDVWYETYESEIAWIHDDNTVTFLSAGTATIYAIAGETDYFLGDTISKTITVTPKLDENIVTALPTATTITYGQLLKESHLEGGESTIEGTFRWFDGDVFLNAGKHTMTVIFEPVEQEIYEVVELPVEVEVLPAEQTMTWELESLVLELGEVIELNASISSDLLVIYSVDNTEVLQVVDNLLYAVGLGEATVTAMQDGMDEFGTPNYQPVSMNYVITVVSDNTGTSLDAIKVDGNATKIIRNGQLLIIRGEHIFDTLGNMMK